MTDDAEARRAERWDLLRRIVEHAGMGDTLSVRARHFIEQAVTSIRDDVRSAGLDTNDESVRLAIVMGMCTGVRLAETMDNTEGYLRIAMLVHEWAPPRS